MTLHNQYKNLLSNTLPWLCYLLLGSLLVHSFVAMAATNNDEYLTKSIDYETVDSGTVFLKTAQGYQVAIALKSDYTLFLPTYIVISARFTNASFSSPGVYSATPMLTVMDSALSGFGKNL